MKKKLLYLMLLLGATITAQENFYMHPPKIFIGIDGYRSTAYQGNGFYNINAGIELFSIPYLAPEVEYEYFIGKLDRKKDLNPHDPNLSPLGFRDYKFKAHMLSISPKITIGRQDWQLCLIPKYSFGTINTTGVYYKLNQEEAAYDLLKVDEQSTKTDYFSFGIGFNFVGFTSEKLSMLITLKYTGIKTQEAFSLLDFSEYGFNPIDQSSETIGLGFRLYFDPFKKIF